MSTPNSKVNLNKEIFLNSMKKQLKDNIFSLIENFHEIIEDTGQVNKATQNEQELLEAQVRASNMVRASQSLLKMVAELKELYILNDFKAINESITKNTQNFNALQANTSNKIKFFKDDLTTHLYEFEDEYYFSHYK